MRPKSRRVEKPAATRRRPGKNRNCSPSRPRRSRSRPEPSGAMPSPPAAPRQSPPLLPPSPPPAPQPYGCKIEETVCFVKFLDLVELLAATTAFRRASSAKRYSSGGVISGVNNFFCSLSRTRLPGVGLPVSVARAGGNGGALWLPEAEQREQEGQKPFSHHEPALFM